MSYIVSKWTISWVIIIFVNDFFFRISNFENEFLFVICQSWKDGFAKAQSLYTQAKQTNYMTEESLDTDYSLEYNLEGDCHSLQMPPRSPMATSSRASRVSSLAHSHRYITSKQTYEWVTWTIRVTNDILMMFSF